MKVKRNSKNSFYRKLKLDKPTQEALKFYRKIKKYMLADCRKEPSK